MARVIGLWNTLPSGVMKDRRPYYYSNYEPPRKHDFTTLFEG